MGKMPQGVYENVHSYRFCCPKEMANTLLALLSHDQLCWIKECLPANSCPPGTYGNGVSKGQLVKIRLYLIPEGPESNVTRVLTRRHRNMHGGKKATCRQK